MSNLTNATGGRWGDHAVLDHHRSVEELLAHDCGVEMSAMGWAGT